MTTDFGKQTILAAKILGICGKITSTFWSLASSTFKAKGDSPVFGLNYSQEHKRI